jgi:nucleoside-diphosphate-sugar epimerase
MLANRAIISGVTGVVGRRIAEELLRLENWRVFGFSRGCPQPSERLSGVDYISIDLLDQRACATVIKELDGVTHFFNAARFNFETGKQDPVDQNTAMFLNVLDKLEQAKHPLAHVHLVQGTNYYGSTLGRFPTPAREGDARGLFRNFYYQQEDIVLARLGRTWSWSASRPHCICAASDLTPRNLPSLIAVYAAICKHLDLPLSFPGTIGNYRAVLQCTDANHLARAIVWMATQPHCADNAFNVTNGDFIRWENMWPEFCRYFDLKSGPVRTIRLSEVMQGREPDWNAIIQRHKLKPTPYERAALWSYGDFVFTPDWDMMSSTTKLRKYGFENVIDTQEMFFGMFDELRRNGIVPGRVGMVTKTPDG